MTVTDIELIKHLDFEPVIHCTGTGHHPECGNQAVWRGIKTLPGMCEHPGLFCEQHKEYVEQWYNNAAPEFLVACPECGSECLAKYIVVRFTRLS